MSGELPGIAGAASREPDGDGRRAGYGMPRGPLGTDPAYGLGSWDSEGLPVLAEQRGSLGEIEEIAVHRWAGGAAGGRDALVVGSGAGHGAAALLAAGAASVTATDHRIEAVATAERLHPDITFTHAEPLALPFQANRFGLVLCPAELVRSPEPDRLLEGLHRVLAADGILVAAVPLTPPRDPITGEPLAVPRDRAGWESALAGLLGNVTLHRLRLSFAAVAGPERDGPEPVDAVEWLGADQAEDRALLAVASDRPLPDLDPVAVMTGTRDLRAFRDTLAAWEQRARRAEAEGAAKHWELVASREAQRRLRKRLHELEHRPLRRISRLLRGRPWTLGPGPPVRASELEPEPWE